MSMILELLTLGLARIEKSSTTDLVEFCFQGLRYPCTDRDWPTLIRTIGYDNIQAVLAKEKDNELP